MKKANLTTLLDGLDSALLSFQAENSLPHNTYLATVTLKASITMLKNALLLDSENIFNLHVDDLQCSLAAIRDGIRRNPTKNPVDHLDEILYFIEHIPLNR